MLRLSLHNKDPRKIRFTASNKSPDMTDENSEADITVEVRSDHDDDTVCLEEEGNGRPKPLPKPKVQCSSGGSKMYSNRLPLWFVSLFLLCIFLAALVVGGFAIASNHKSSSSKENQESVDEGDDGLDGPSSPKIPEEPVPKDCCDPAKEPGVEGNPLCFEGHACCPADGTWSCSIGDGRTFPCGNELVVNPQGKVCDDPTNAGCLNSNHEGVGCFKTTQELADYCASEGCANWDCTETECITFEEAQNCWISCDTFSCFRRCGCPPEFAIGRPFKENTDGTAILAEAEPEQCNSGGVCMWSKSSRSSLSDVAASKQQQQAAEDNDEAKLNTAEDWIEQGLGEHASIASFAAFTISLMTNQAPPNLIRDALQAALDELDHAERAFGMAKLLSPSSSEAVAPGALPASQLSFQANLTDLAVSTALEGCIGETMAAIELAIQADEIAATTRDGTVDDIAFETKWKIAMDEARHSSLAWRTIHWICQTSEEACTAVKDVVLNKDYLSTSAVSTERFGKSTDIAQEAWNRICGYLLPLMDAHAQAFHAVDCVGSRKVSSSSTASGVSKLVAAIITEVSCPLKDQSVD